MGTGRRFAVARSMTLSVLAVSSSRSDRKQVRAKFRLRRAQRHTVIQPRFDGNGKTVRRGPLHDTQRARGELLEVRSETGQGQVPPASRAAAHGDSATVRWEREDGSPWPAP